MIKITDLCKEINHQKILDHLNLDIPSAQIMVILGASGSGKTVLLQHMIGLMKPDEGSIEIDGVDITKLSERQLLEVRKNIGYLFQEGALYDFMSVEENVSFPLREHTQLNETAIDKKVQEVLKLVGLEGAPDKMPAELSGGMRKRAALARAIILSSRILFCDEPTSGLDPLRSRDIMDLIRQVSKKMNCTTVLTSHDVPNSLRIADRLALIDGGRLAAVGPVSQIRASPDPLVQNFFGSSITMPSEAKDG